jgi:U32 family peptidase
MSRFFRNQEVELLAPVGTFEIFDDVIRSGADAVYLGGKILNMRMHRKDYNLTNQEIENAIKFAHSLNKKVYITVNNLFSQHDLEAAKDYLLFLKEVKPDALIIQDFSVLDLVKSLNIDIPLHSSVMMNVHNIATINALKNLGVTRIVASREMDLKTVKLLQAQTSIEFEYFTHGDMCIVHGAQCLYSGVLFGKSSNRGLCMKPCRWNFAIKKDGKLYPSEYPMAVKDMYMYEHIPEMIDAGIVSFKIEGRMRDSDYLISLINNYSDAINRYIDDPICYDRKKGSKVLYERRKRDLSTGYAFGKPGLSNINRRYEGTGVFYSHGKVFSNPVEEIEISEQRINEIKSTLNENIAPNNKPYLSVKVNNYIQAKMAIEENVDLIYLSGDVFIPDKPFSKNEILDLICSKKNSKIYLCLPRMMSEKDFAEYQHLLQKNALSIDGLVVTNLGAIQEFNNLGIELVGDYCMNIYNNKAANFFKQQGLSVSTLSIEAPLKDVMHTVMHSDMPIELIAHGSPVVMYLEHDLYENTKILDPIKDENNKHFDNNVLTLVDDKGFEHPVFKDNKERNHVLLYKDICYLPILKELYDTGVTRFRIEGCHYNVSELKSIIKIYKRALENLNNCKELYDALKPIHAGFTLGSFQFD